MWRESPTQFVRICVSLVALFFLRFGICYPGLDALVRLPVASPATVAASPEAGPSTGGKASGISAVIKATERAGVCSWLTVKTRRPVEGVAVVEVVVVEVAMVEVAVIKIAVIKVAAIKSAVIESAAIKGSAMRDEGVMVVHCPTAMPVVPPVTPAPTKPSEEPETKSDTEGESDAAPKNPGHGIPARVGDDRRPVPQPRIIAT